jgi:hypothetical protein
MKLLKRTLIAFVGLISLLAIVVLLFYRQEAYQLYKVLTFFEKDEISYNFKSIHKIFNVNVVPKPATSFNFLSAKNQISLPEKFNARDSSITTQAFLDFTLTDALLIIRHDSILYEYYGNGFTAGDHHISWSMAKSVVSALFGIALEEGKIKSIEQTVTDYLPEFKGTGYDGVRIKDVLQMSSGVGFNEDYGDFNSDIESGLTNVINIGISIVVVDGPRLTTRANFMLGNLSMLIRPISVTASGVGCLYMKNRLGVIL